MYKDISLPEKVWLCNDHYILAKEIGQLHLEINLGDRMKELTIIHSAYYVPDISRNLLSISYLLKQGFSVNFCSNECCIFSNKGQELCGTAKELMASSYSKQANDSGACLHLIYKNWDK